MNSGPPTGRSVPIPLRSAGRIVRTSPDEIQCVEAADDRCRVTTRSGSMEVREGFGAFLQRLSAEDFVRISRSAAVRLDAVIELEPKSPGDWRVRLASGRELVVARTRRAELIARLNGTWNTPPVA